VHAHRGILARPEDAQLARHGARSDRMVPGDHHRRHPGRARGGDSVDRFGAGRVGDAQQAEHLQALLVEARGLIPPDESFAVAVGPPQPGWTELTANGADLFLRSFLLPRRLDPEARWIVCVGCDRNDYPGADAVWEGEDGLSVLRRES